MAQIHILKGGLLTTVQDSGRHGYQMYGMPVAGAMDLVSLRLANALVRNHPKLPCWRQLLPGRRFSSAPLGGAGRTTHLP